MTTQTYGPVPTRAGAPSAAASPALDRLADLAGRLLGADGARVSLAPAPDEAGWADPLSAVVAGSAGPLVVPDAAADARLAGLPDVGAGTVSACLGVRLVAERGAVVGTLHVVAHRPREWTAADVAVLEQLAPSVLAQVELSALSAEYDTSRLRWDVALEAAEIGSFAWDLVSDRVDWDERLQSLYGYEPGEFVPHITEAFRRIHVEDVPTVEAAIAAALASCGEFRCEYRISLPGGSERWVSARGRAVAGADGTAGQLVGAAYDVTDTHAARDRATHLLDTMATGFLQVDRDWRVRYLNETGERVAGMPADALVGRDLWEAFPGLADLEFGARYRQAVASGEPDEFEAYYPHLQAWLEVRAVPGPDGLALYFLDVTARRLDGERARAAQQRAESAVARLHLLATVSAELAATLEVEQAVARLARLVVPALGEWALVTLVEDDGLRDVGWQHADPAMRPLVERYAAGRLAALTDRSYVRQALDTGQPVVVRTGASAAVSEVLVPGPTRDLLVELAPESIAVFPLRARGRTLGLLTLFRSGGGAGLTDADVATARDVAARAGLAVDNARLYSQQRSLAEGLQRSLLTDPPEPDHCQVVVRYVPAAEAASVGGDWFDSFLQADGATVLVIGDVVGHDTQAAAAMGQVRGLLRGIAWHSGARPAEVLRGLDAAMEGLQVQTMATAVVARLEQTVEEHGSGTTRLVWSNAGHPPPMVLHPDGAVGELEVGAPDLLLGFDPRTERTDTTVALDRDATVLLYTDGLVERRGQSLDEGIALLRRTMAELADRTLDQVCDELLARLLPDSAEDDVALVAVRLHRQDRPRPAEAGPNRVPPEVPDHL